MQLEILLEAFIDANAVIFGIYELIINVANISIVITYLVTIVAIKNTPIW